MSRRTLFKLLVGLGVLLILCAALGVNRVYYWSFGFVDMPPNDEELRQWLADQPGVEGPEVWREDNELRIRYHVRSWRRGPDNFSPPWERLGYQGFILLNGTALGAPHSTSLNSYPGWGW
jgi:hypothetical protein